MKADYERQAAGLSDLLARLTAEQKQLSNGVDQQHPALVAFAKYQNIEKLTREILIELVDHIKIYENGNISVRFKFADEFRRIAEYIESNTTDTAEFLRLTALLTPPSPALHGLLPQRRSTHPH